MIKTLQSLTVGRTTTNFYVRYRPATMSYIVGQLSGELFVTISQTVNCFLCSFLWSLKENDADLATLSELLCLFPPTCGGEKSKKKRKKISPEQALRLLIQEECVSLLFLYCCSINAAAVFLQSSSSLRTFV
jgi:hypothetical protein